MFSPKFPPRLIPEITRSGRLGSNLFSARITESAGVPSTAHSRSATCSQKIGCRSVSDCADALRSWLGATTLIVPSPSTAWTSARKPSA